MSLVVGGAIVVVVVVDGAIVVVVVSSRNSKIHVVFYLNKQTVQQALSIFKENAVNEQYTLREKIFAGRKFREFWPNSQR